jgi:hypothetical protein
LELVKGLISHFDDGIVDRSEGVIGKHKDGAVEVGDCVDKEKLCGRGCKEGDREMLQAVGVKNEEVE